MSLINLLKIRVQITIMTSKKSLFLLARLHKKKSLWNHLPVLNYLLSPCVFPTSQDTSKTRGFLFALSDGLLCQLAHAPSYPTLHTHPLPLCPWVLQPSLMSHFARLQHFQRHTDHPPMELLTDVPAASDFLCNERENKQDVFTIKPCFRANCLHTIPSFIHYQENLHFLFIMFISLCFHIAWSSPLIDLRSKCRLPPSLDLWARRCRGRWLSRLRADAWYNEWRYWKDRTWRELTFSHHLQRAGIAGALYTLSNPQHIFF